MSSLERRSAFLVLAVLLASAGPGRAQDGLPGDSDEPDTGAAAREEATGVDEAAPAVDPAQARARLLAPIPDDLDPAVHAYLEALAAMAVSEHETALGRMREAVELALDHPTEPARLAAIAALLSLRGALNWVPRSWIEPAIALADRVPLDKPEWVPVLNHIYGLRTDLHYDVADVTAAERDTADRGCLVGWRGTGPEGPTAYHRWWRDPPADFALRPATWAPGQNRPAEPEQAWEPESYLCSLTLGRPGEVRSGVVRLSGIVDFPEGLRHAVMHVTTGDPFLVRIDGTEVLRHDPFRETIGTVFDVAIDAPPGRHRIDFQLASGWGRPVFSVSLLGVDEAGRPVPLTSDGDLSVEAPAAFLGRVRELELRPADPWTALVALDVLEGMGRGEAAARGAEQLADSSWGEDNPLAQLRAAAAVLRDPTLSLPEARKRATDRFELLGDLQDALVPSLSARAGWALEDGDLDDAIPMLRRARVIYPNDVDILQQLESAYGSRGWIEESRGIVEGLEATMPDSCAVKRLRLSFAYDAGDTAGIEAAAREMVRCLPSSFDRLSTLNRAQNWDAVIAEIERLRPLYGDPDMPDVAIAMTRLRRGETAGFEELLRRELADDPGDSGTLDALVDLLLREGRTDEALALLQTHVTLGQPTNTGAVESVAALQGYDAYSALYIPAPLAIAAYEARRAGEEAPATQILDHTVSRVFDDGTIRMITHTILKLSSQEAIEQYGQSGGRGALAARTIAPDGTPTNVVNLAQAGVGSFPNLTPGCYIEVFDTRVQGAPTMLGRGTDHWRFYFQSVDETMARTEFVLFSPEDYPLDFSPRAEPPQADDLDLGALHLRRWMDRDVPPLRLEPMSIQSDAYVPSLRVSRGFEWNLLFAGLADSLYASDYVPLEVAAFARDTCRGKDEAGCLRALYDWILDEIEGGGFGDSVASTYQRRSGSRSRLIVALLRAAGFSPRLLLATSLDRDLTETDVAEAGRFYYPVVEAGGRMFTIEADEASLGYLPAEIRGMPAIVYDPLGAELETVTLPDPEEQREGFLVDLDLDVDPDGGRVDVRGSIEITGGFAADFRDGLLSRSPADREGDLTLLFVAPSFPGAAVDEIAIDGLDDREAPLVVRFTAGADGLTVRRGGTLLLPAPVPQQLSAGYAPLPVIEHPAMAFPPQRIELSIRIHAPGWRLGGLAGQGVDAAGVLFEQESTDTEDGGTLRRSLRIDDARLEPDDYPPFAQAVRRAENLWNLPVELRQAR